MGEEVNGADSTLLDGAQGAEDNNTPPAGGDDNPVDNSTSAEGAGDNTGDNSEGTVDKGGDSGDNKDTSKTLLSGDEGEGEGEGQAVEYSFETPEGMQISDEMQAGIDAFKEQAGEMGLSQEQFQKIVEFDIQRGEEALAGLSEQYNQRINDWADEVRNDSVIGGEALQENLATAKSAIKEFGTEGFQKLLAAPSAENPEGLGLGNHPEVIKLFVSLGKKLGEGNLVTGDSRVESGDSLKQMYPSMFSNG